MDLEKIWADFDKVRPKGHEIEPVVQKHEYFCICGGLRVFNDDRLPTCVECGRTDHAFVSDEPEWRGGMDADGNVSDPSRVGAPTNLDHFSGDWNMGTIMRVRTSAGSKLKRLARINMHMSMNHRDRSLFHTYADLDRVGHILGLPENVMYAVKCKYRQFSDSVLTRGAVRTGIKANCVFQACKEFNISRTTQEIADAFAIPVRDVSRTSEAFLELHPEKKVTVTTAADLVNRFFNGLTNIPEADRGRLRMKVIARCRQLEDHPGLQGRTPKAIAAAVMFSILKDRGVTKADLATICEVSVPTITKLETIILKQEGT